jgi:hypothetical protein
VNAFRDEFSNHSAGGITMSKPKLFVSYSSDDAAHLRDLDPLKRFTELWYDKEIVSGNIIAERLKDGINSCLACLFLQTKNSLRSTWCTAEVAAFWAAGKPVIIWEVDRDITSKAQLPFLAGVRTAKTFAEVRDALRLIQNHSSNNDDKEPSFGNIPLTKAVIAIADSIEHKIIPLQQTIEGLHDRISYLAPFEENSLFGQRFKHFFDEKRAIARVFLRELEQFISQLREREDNRMVRLLLDSGTTVFPIFSMLMERKKEPLLRESIEIVTNNMAGIAIIMRDGRMDEGDPHSRSAYKVLSVSGEPFPAYWAILPQKPEESLRRALRQCGDTGHGDPITIAVTTSNYLKDNGKSLFVRTADHAAFKRVLMREADIIYLLFPLGKMLNATVDDLNNKLVKARDRGKTDHVYENVPIPFQPNRKVVFITTKRSAGDCLRSHFLSVHERLSVLQRECQNKGCEVDMIFLETEEFSMSNLSRGEQARQEELEMPHKYHRPHVMKWLRWQGCSLTGKPTTHPPPPTRRKKT